MRREQAQEEHTESQDPGEHGPNGHVTPPQALAEPSHRHGHRDGGDQQAREGVDAQRCTTQGPRKGHVRQRLTGEGLVTQHDKVTDQSGEDAQDGPREQGLPHEVILQHRLDVLPEVQGEGGEHSRDDHAHASPPTRDA